MRAIERSQKIASAAVTEMMETHGMLRNDTSALFERLREANVLLQEVLGGATENLGTIETTLSGRVSEFVTTMNDIGDRSGAASDRFEDQMKAFLTGTGDDAARHHDAARQVRGPGQGACGCGRPDRQQQRRTEEVMEDRREALDSVVNQIDSKVGDLDSAAQALLGAAAARPSRPPKAAPATSRACSPNPRPKAPRRSPTSTNWCAPPPTRSASARARRCNSIYEQATGETSALFRQTSEKFIEIVRQMKEMSAAMQREMEATRTELRKGILELPQETAESAAQMRRVIVEQIDALAELNRIVARHSRDTAEQPARRAEPVAAAGGTREAARPARYEEPRRVAARAMRRPPAAAPRRAPPPEAAGAGRRRRRRLADRPARPRLARRAGAAARQTIARRAGRWSRSTASRSTSRA